MEELDKEMTIEEAVAKFEKEEKEKGVEIHPVFQVVFDAFSNLPKK